MIPSQIEREVIIDAPVEVVWRVVTEPDEMARWFCEAGSYEPRPGSEGRIRMSERNTFNIRIEAVEPHRRFAFRWVHPDGELADERNSMLVEFTFEPVQGQGRTRLRVVESGFDTVDWSEEAKRTYAEGHENGWPKLLERLRDLLAAKA